MERIFTNALKKALRQRIKGTISVHVANGILVVDIFDNAHKAWRYTLNNLSAKLSIGVSSKIVADVIVKEYRKYIINQYFR
jgi:hypothetical protein